MTHTTHSDNLEESMSELTIKDKVEEILRKNFKETVDRAIEQHNERIVEFAERSRVIREQSTDQIMQLINSAITEARIRGIEEAHKEILERAYTYTGEDELSDFCGVDDLSRVAMSWKVDRIKELKNMQVKVASSENNTTKQEDINHGNS